MCLRGFGLNLQLHTQTYTETVMVRGTTECRAYTSGSPVNSLYIQMKDLRLETLTVPLFAA